MKNDAELLSALERDQFTDAAERLLPRRNLARGTLILLILLRAYVFIAIPLIGYAFVHALLTSS